MVIKNVIIVGANGHLGPHVLKGLMDAKSFNITVLTRASSKSQYPQEVNQARISDSLPPEELEQALRGQDALIICVSGNLVAESLKLIDAAAEVGVKRVIPADFGSCDSSDPSSLELIPLYNRKKVVREHLEQLTLQGQISWTSLICGHFFDFGLVSEPPLLSANIPKRKITIFDDGNVKWSTTMFSTIGLAVARILQNEDQFMNRLVYIQSVSLTQNELLQSLERITGDKFEVEKVSSEDYIKERKAQLEQKPTDHDLLEELVCVGGIINADWEKKDNFVNEELGLPKENLDDIIKRVLQQKS